MSFNPYPEWGRGADEADVAAGLKAFRTPLPEYLGAQVREGFWATLPGQALAQRDRLTAEAPNESPLTAEEWRASPHFRPSIPFDEKFTPARAKAVADIHDENAYRRWLIDQRDAGALDGTLGFVAGIAGSIPDPVNFIPFFGPAFRAARIAKYGAVAGRALMGAGEGALGTAIAQPFLVPSRNQFGDDVGFADITMDIAFGAFAGAAIGGASGVWSKFTATRVEALGRKAADADLTVAPRDTSADPVPDVPRQNAALYTLDRAAQDVAAGRPVDIDPRVASEMAGVRRAYDAVRSEPMGLKDDPLVSITPEQIDATAIARGGWKGLGDAEVPGSGSGLVKIIWRHGEESRKPVAERVTREDVMALPNVVRELQAKSGAKEANRMWVRQRDDGEHVVYIDGPTDGGRRVLSIFVAKNKAEYPLSPNLGEGGSPGRVRSPAGDTAREPLGRLPESRDGNMPPQGRAVNFAKAAPEPAALPEPERIARNLPELPPEIVPTRDPKASPYDKVPPAPQRLSDFLKAFGGIKDDGGEVSTLMGRKNGMPGLINSKRGMSLDDATRNAWENGYFPEFIDRPPPDVLLAALGDELGGKFRYRPDDDAGLRAAILKSNEQIDQLANELGIDTRGLTRAQFDDLVAERMSAEDAYAADLALADDVAAAYTRLQAEAEAFLASRGEAWAPEWRREGRPRTLADLEAEDAQFRMAQGDRGRGPDAGNARSAGQSANAVPVDPGQGRSGADPERGSFGQAASPERRDVISDTVGLLDDAEALVATGRLSAEDAATLKAARQTLADTAAFDDGAAAAASCFRR